MNSLRLFPGQTVFLDRDGTINRPAPQGDYISNPSELELLPGAADAIRSLNQLDITTIVVTNQRGIDLGLMSEDDLRNIHQRLSDLLAKNGAYLDGIFYCPHGKGTCDCRKPNPGLLEQANDENPRVTLAGALMVGDTEADVEAGRALGLSTIRLSPEPSLSTNASLVFPSLAEAVRRLIPAQPLE